MANKKKQMEGDVYYPSDEVVAQANAQDWDAMAEKALKDPQAFWEAEANELEWFEKWEKVLDDSNKPFFKWFVGAKTNIVHNAIDRHLKTHRKNKLALIWEKRRWYGPSHILLLCNEPRSKPNGKHYKSHGRW